MLPALFFISSSALTENIAPVNLSPYSLSLHIFIFPVGSLFLNSIVAVCPLTTFILLTSVSNKYPLGTELSLNQYVPGFKFSNNNKPSALDVLLPTLLVQSSFEYKFLFLFKN